MKCEDYFLSLIKKGVFKIDSYDGKIYRIKRRKNQYADFMSCEPKLLDAKIPRGYIMLRGSKNYRILGHRLVWLYFNGKIPNGLQINHKNGKKEDNRLCNLETVTQSQNMRHAIDVLGISFSGKGNKAHYHKLNERNVLQIKRMLKDGMLQTQIAKLFGVCLQTISAIFTGKTWAYLENN